MLFVTLILIQIAIFGGLALLLRHLLTRQMTSASGHLQALTEECTKHLEEAKVKREEAQKYYDEMLVKTREEADQIKLKLMEEGQKDKEEIIRQARLQSEEITDRARAAAETLSREWDRKVEERALEKAGEMVQELLKGKVAEETHGYWIQQLLKNGFDGLKRLHIQEDAKEAEVVTAFSLKPKEIQSIEARLTENLGRRIALKEKVDPNLILGLRLTLGNIVIDGSLRSKIQSWVREAQHA